MDKKDLRGSTKSSPLLCSHVVFGACLAPQLSLPHHCCCCCGMIVQGAHVEIVANLDQHNSRFVPETYKFDEVHESTQASLLTPWSSLAVATGCSPPTHPPTHPSCFLSGGNLRLRSVDDPNGTGSRGGAGGPKHQNASAVKARRGIFQKASVDEAYLEPTRRTLMAELLLSSERENKTPGTAAERSNSTDRAPTAAELLTAGAKRPRRTESSVGGVPSSANHAEEPWRHGGGDGRDQALSGSGQDSTENQNRLYTPDEIEGDVEAGYDSVGDDGHQNGFGRPRRSGSNARTESIEEEEEAQLLEAGGLLGIRIQKTLRDVLKYDCSVGVAGNKVRYCFVSSSV